VKQEGKYHVFVANNGQDFQRGSYHLAVNYHKLIDIYEVYPKKVQIDANRINITVFGYNFPTQTRIYCIFGKPEVFPYQQFEVEAVILSDT
jgi:hypothetical protein